MVSHARCSAGSRTLQVSGAVWNLFTVGRLSGSCHRISCGISRIQCVQVWLWSCSRPAGGISPRGSSATRVRTARVGCAGGSAWSSRGWCSSLTGLRRSRRAGSRWHPRRLSFTAALVAGLRPPASPKRRGAHQVLGTSPMPSLSSSTPIPTRPPMVIHPNRSGVPPQSGLAFIIGSSLASIPPLDTI